MSTQRYSRFSTGLIALIMAVTIFITLPTPKTALAALINCRSDPVVLLSNGTLLDVSADIGTLLFNVEEVHYTLHIPSGLSVVLAISTPTWPTTVETFTVYADNPPGQFTTHTVVHTAHPNTAVTANLLVNLTYRTTSGVSGQNLTVNIQQ